MTTALAPQLSRFGRLLRWSSIGSGGAYSNIKRLAQIGRTSSPFNVTNRSFTNYFAISRRAAAARHQSPTSSAAAKSP